jgi:hypothetical protein
MRQHVSLQFVFALVALSTMCWSMKLLVSIEFVYVWTSFVVWWIVHAWQIVFIAMLYWWPMNSTFTCESGISSFFLLEIDLSPNELIFTCSKLFYLRSRHSQPWPAIATPSEPQTNLLVVKAHYRWSGLAAAWTELAKVGKGWLQHGGQPNCFRFLFVWEILYDMVMTPRCLKVPTN